MPFRNVLFAAAVSVAYAQQGPTVTISSGSVEGTILPSGAKGFFGIPFAQSPPVRFTAPKDPKPWTQPLKATALRPACVQEIPYPERVRNFTIAVFGSPEPEESEDCLYVNVWTPAAPPPPGGYAVMFWIYGGNLQMGTASMPMYNGERIASSRGVILVSANYRTNVFGFPNSPELPKGEGNPGFLDQRKALNWASKNIAAFGGDPSKITIFGESAGGWSVKQLIALPPSPLPFRAAIMQSEAAGVSGGTEAWVKLGTALNCTGNTLACVQAAPASTIKYIVDHQALSFDPIKDDVTCSSNVSTTITSGKAAKVPIIIGTNADDGTAFSVIFANMEPGTPEAVATSKGLTELTFQCPAALIADITVANGYPNVYRYFFNASFPQYFPFKSAGAYHIAEVQPIFGTYAKKQTEMDRVSSVMQTKWTDFAKNPTAPLAGWPNVAAGTAGNHAVMKFGVTEDEVIKSSAIDQACAAMQGDVLLGGL